MCNVYLTTHVSTCTPMLDKRGITEGVQILFLGVRRVLNPNPSNCETLIMPVSQKKKVSIYIPIIHIKVRGNVDRTVW